MTPAAAPALEDAFAPVSKSTRCPEVRRRTVEAVVELGVELAREGREGRKIGTLFVIGHTDEVLARSHPLILDPLAGHPPELRQIARPEFRETVKELAQLDGAFVVDDDGVFVAGARYVDVDLSERNFTAGLGTRHAAAASITQATRAVAVVVSQSAVVRVYAHGAPKAEVIPELFLMSQQGLFLRDAAISRLPQAGVTLAVADPAA
jgi:diadenylate cyclase